MHARAIARDITMSPRKVRVVADMVRCKPVEEALAILQLLPKRSARQLTKVVRSAVANADDRSEGSVDVDALYIKTIFVDGAGITKRWMPRAQGRATRINHRSSHITVLVSDEA